MPSRKAYGKPGCKPTWHFLFSEALHQPRSIAMEGGTPSPGHSSTNSNSKQDYAVEVGCRIEGLDSNISALAAETKSIHLDTVGFQNRVTDLEHRITTVEAHLNVIPDGNQELLFLRSKVIDLEDRSRRNNAHFFVSRCT
ncbi:hypothetical protein NDU88_003139 [Pleurodeles waltl]|uniref:Uncharacterized protein n=1 Tax=Pleurodeles waltl TaxID=8319 RepID=A0AAV7MRF0_PLEWA|nr:hypothetical protein NDU88_003139 [Pleurodeles waltl]